jgi:hypothetical protein
MVTNIYSDILKQGTSKGYQYGDVELRDWFRDKALQLTSSQTSINRTLNRQGAKASTVPTARIGRMLMYRYDPKHKATLPYYDKFPIIFPIEKYKDGWLGINLHYLPPVYRARLMDALYDLINNDQYDETTKLKISYKLLANVAKTRYFRPCIKRYLFSHVKSSLVEIDPKEWDYCAFLPLARFAKADQRKVWDDSIKMIQAKR